MGSGRSLSAWSLTPKRRKRSFGGKRKICRVWTLKLSFKLSGAMAHRDPEADLPVSTRYRGIVKLQATTAGVCRDTAEAPFQHPGAVNSSVRTPAWQVKHDLSLPKTRGNAILSFEPLGIRATWD